MEQLTIQEIAILVTAISTVIYTIGTFLLWYVTHKSLRLTKREIERKEQLLQTTYVSNVYKNFREIYTQIINDEEKVKLLAKEQNSSVEEVRREYVASFLINHSFEIYNYNVNNLMPAEFWKRVVTDMKVLFEWEFIQQRWQKMRPLFPREYVEFIDEHILKPKIF